VEVYDETLFDLADQPMLWVCLRTAKVSNELDELMNRCVSVASLHDGDLNSPPLSKKTLLVKLKAPLVTVSAIGG
jgi:hypothetical protein